MNTDAASWLCAVTFLATTFCACAAEKALERPATPQSPAQFLEDKARKLIAGCRVRANDGTTFFTPDGQGNYRALWTRDFAYMVENAGNLMSIDDVESCLRALIRGVRADGAAPDRVRPDGVAVYVAGPENRPLGEPNIDNAQFLVIAVDEYLQRLPGARRRGLFTEWAPTFDRAMNYIPRSTNGLVYNDPAKPHSPYGFTDTVGKTGELLFESLLDWTASRRLAAHYLDGGDERSAKTHSARAAMTEGNLAVLWDDKAGAFLAAARDCRQIDVWGNAYAIWLDFPLGGKRARVLRFLQENREGFIWHGQVRHLPAGEHWQRLLTPVPPGRYQNGAYWATASGWMMWSLAQSDRSLARRMWNDLIDDFKRGDVCECVNEGYRQLPSYVVSAVNPLAAARRLGF
ncbi:MAG: hypothetical protein HY735_08250 [Verrucomicrobia bacterium]|nr:hypothetical protein [Verrucomicrobiota bacterium]